MIDDRNRRQTRVREGFLMRWRLHYKYFLSFVEKDYF